MTSQLLQRILTDCWAIKEDYGRNFLNSLIIQSTKDSSGGQSFSELKAIRREAKKNTQPKFMVATTSQSNEPTYKVVTIRDIYTNGAVPSGSIMMLNIDGVITRQTDWCNKGLDSYAAELEFAGSNPNIKAVVLKLHSPGGSVYGVEGFSNLVADFQKTYQKPLAAFVSQMADSAGYFIIAAAPRIFLDGKMSEVGSIGTMFSTYDFSEVMKKEGIKEIVINATMSENKNKEYLSLMGDTPNFEPMREMLDKFNEVFTSKVKSGRSGKLNYEHRYTLQNGKSVPTALTGKTYIGQDAIDAGLADEIGTMATVVKYLEKQVAANEKDGVFPINQVQPISSSDELPLDIQDEFADTEENQDTKNTQANTYQQKETQQIFESNFLNKNNYPMFYLASLKTDQELDATLKECKQVLTSDSTTNDQKGNASQKLNLVEREIGYRKMQQEVARVGELDAKSNQFQAIAAEKTKEATSLIEKNATLVAQNGTLTTSLEQAQSQTTETKQLNAQLTEKLEQAEANATSLQAKVTEQVAQIAQANTELTETKAKLSAAETKVAEYEKFNKENFKGKKQQQQVEETEEVEEELDSMETGDTDQDIHDTVEQNSKPQSFTELVATMRTAHQKFNKNN